MRGLTRRQRTKQCEVLTAICGIEQACVYKRSGSAGVATTTTDIVAKISDFEPEVDEDGGWGSGTLERCAHALPLTTI